jgi:mevalonate kinase
VKNEKCKMKGEVFYAKIMLFGEYSVIFDSMALTIPYSHFTGELRFINQEQYTNYELALESNHHLRDYLPYLKDLQAKAGFRDKLDLEQLENDINNGLYFESNIPQGYGIGSSGALVAAIYDQYLLQSGKNRKIFTSMEISSLKEVFSRMESYFHGVSSGLDPLLCYIRHPLLIRNKMQIETVGIPGDKFGANSAIFLVDSGILGKTGPLVNLFFESCKKEDFLNQVRNVFIPANNGCIESLLKGDMEHFFNHLTELSAYQFLYLPEMIPPGMKSTWESGLHREDFKMKLCGSGGGGFLLGISNDFRSTRKYFKQKGLELIPVFKNN